MYRQYNVICKVSHVLQSHNQMACGRRWPRPMMSSYHRDIRGLQSFMLSDGASISSDRTTRHCSSLDETTCSIIKVNVRERENAETKCKKKETQRGLDFIHQTIPYSVLSGSRY